MKDNVKGLIHLQKKKKKKTYGPYSDSIIPSLF